MPYHRLDVYQKAYQLALEVHRLSLGFPKLGAIWIGAAVAGVEQVDSCEYR